MRKRLGGVVALAMTAALIGSPTATAETVREKVARQQAETKARIACTQAKVRGQTCGSAAPTSTSRSRPARAPSSSVERAAPSGTEDSSPGKRIEISLAEQTLRAYEGSRLFMEAPVSTGAKGYATPTGRYSILSKETRHWSTQYHVWMPYAMRVVNGIFIHELPVTRDGRRLGTSSLGSPVSHGCIRVGVGPAERLFSWTPVGTPVVIR